MEAVFRNNCIKKQDWVGENYIKTMFCGSISA